MTISISVALRETNSDSDFCFFFLLVWRSFPHCSGKMNLIYAYQALHQKQKNIGSLQCSCYDWSINTFGNLATKFEAFSVIFSSIFILDVYFLPVINSSYHFIIVSGKPPWGEDNEICIIFSIVTDQLFFLILTDT